jgi:thioredoxin-dependent peroxiredoxin
MSAIVLSPGDKAPSFSLLDQDGNKVTLASLKGSRVMVFFYPKANTPGCTQQACSLRDIAGQIGDVQIVGVSPDKASAQKNFDEKFSLGYPLLADTEHEMAEAYGVWKLKKNYGREYMGVERSAFLIGATGRIEEAWYKISPKDTPVRLLEALGR